MIKTIPASFRHFTDFGWLKTFWLFSFSNYYAPANVRFGALRVFNDDVIQPGRGFSEHPHENMEIISVLLEGEMVHKDNMGNKMVIKAGDVQTMTAGTGITHSELNETDKPVHFFQIWILPNKKELMPAYDQKHYKSLNWKNKLFPIASGEWNPKSTKIQTNATIYRAKIDASHKLTHKVSVGSKQFIYVIDGSLLINDTTLQKGDQARMHEEKKLKIKADASAEFIFIDLNE